MVVLHPGSKKRYHFLLESQGTIFLEMPMNPAGGLTNQSRYALFQIF